MPRESKELSPMQAGSLAVVIPKKHGPDRENMKFKGRIAHCVWFARVWIVRKKTR